MDFALTPGEEAEPNRIELNRIEFARGVIGQLVLSGLRILR